MYQLFSKMLPAAPLLLTDFTLHSLQCFDRSAEGLLLNADYAQSGWTFYINMVLDVRVLLSPR